MLLGLISCDDKKLFQKKNSLGDIEVTQYAISLITSTHDHLDVSKNGEIEERILKVNSGDIDSVFLVKDTLLIKTVRHPVIYDKKDRAFNYLIKIDSLQKAVNDTIY